MSASNGLIHVPQSVDDFQAAKPSDVNTEASSFLRTHWEQVKAYYLAFSGEGPTINGSFPADEWGVVFKIQEMARLNGYALLGNVPAAQLRRALRVGYKRNTATPVWMLERQSRQLRLGQIRRFPAPTVQHDDE